MTLRTSHPRRVFVSDVQLLAEAAPQDTDAGSALQNLESDIPRVQGAPVDQERRAQPRTVVIPVLADLWGSHRDPVHRVLCEVLDQSGFALAGRHGVEVRGRPAST